MTTPIKVYGSRISYYTGKLEGYLRYKEIPYEFISFGPMTQRRLRQKTGAGQMPAVELADGRFMTDTTPMIDFFEAQYSTPAVIPVDPLQSFMSRLVEDYAEEWLWRPAMHYRWSYRVDALLLSRKIVDEIVRVPIPGFLKRFVVRRRQHGGWVRGDGVTSETWDHVEGCYLQSLDRLNTIFANRPFLLGEVPTLGDFGFFASMFRHFSQDPTASDIMRERAPAVFEWQARLWNARASSTGGELVQGIPTDWGPILDDIGTAYLPYLCANTEAWMAHKKRHDALIQSVQYRDLPVSQYRVWCLEKLRIHYEALADSTQTEVRELLEKHGCWAPLWKITNVDSQYDPAGEVPFKGKGVHYSNSRNK